MPKLVFTPIIESLPYTRISNLFFVDLEARKRSEDLIEEAFGLKAYIDYSWYGDDIVIISDKGREMVKETYNRIKGMCRFDTPPKYKTLFGHRIIQ